MQTRSENMKKYGEEMTGKFHEFDGRKIVISVIKPFVKEIHIECDYDVSQEFYNPYSLLDPQEAHPEKIQWGMYYNTQHKCYYRFQWIAPWVRTDTEYIKEHTIRYERLLAHFRRCRNEIHKGQLCFFRGYAIDPKGDPTLPSIVESMFDRHKWLYDPFSFKVELLDQNTIDDFVAETPISKEMTDKMVLYHQEQDEIKRQKEEDDKNKKKKEKRETFWNNINAHIGKYEKIYRYGVVGGILVLIITILQIIFSRPS